MRKTLAWLTALCLLLPAAVNAEEAADITQTCGIELVNYSAGARYLMDRNYETVAVASSRLESQIIIKPPENTHPSGLYIVWADDVMPYRVERLRGGEWEAFFWGSAALLHAYVPLDGGNVPIRIVPENSATKYLRVKELYVLGEGDAPHWVQRWTIPSGKVDLLVLSAHPDDEWIFMGGSIPYAIDKGKRVAVAYLTTASSRRRSELLDGLWHGGVRLYPDMTSGLPDYMTNSLKDQYTKWSKKTVYAYVTGLYRRFRPDVVITHDVNGEYGHGAHRVAADAAQKAVQMAADAAEGSPGAPWQVQKLYLHLYPENALVMDWRQPLAAFGGKTALDIAREAFRFHKSQDDGTWEVTDEGRKANNLFGLVFSTVGPDTPGDDFFSRADESK